MIPDYEEVAAIVAVEMTADVTQSEVQYSALIRSELTHPPTEYETINLANTEQLVVSQQYRPGVVDEQSSGEYANVSRWRIVKDSQSVQFYYI